MRVRGRGFIFFGGGIVGLMIQTQCNENLQFTELHQRSGKNTTVVA